MQCANNFKQVGVAMHNYHAAKGCFPPGIFEPWAAGWSNVPDWWSWVTYLLPCMEQQAVYDMINFSHINSSEDYNFWSGPPTQNRQAAETWISGYLCPSDPQSQGGPAEGGSVSSSTPNDFAAVTNMVAVADTDQAWNTSGSQRRRAYVSVTSQRHLWRQRMLQDRRHQGRHQQHADGRRSQRERSGNAYAAFSGRATTWAATADGINGVNTAVGGTFPQSI